MNLFIWRHNRKYHSWSMINEPCIHEDFYTDAIAMVVAESEEQALEILAKRRHGWRMEDLPTLHPKVIELDTPRVVFEDIRGE
jgi:hypothetical protein